MLATIQEVVSFIGKTTTVTEAELGRINLIQPGVERAVKRYLGYDPEQVTRTLEYHPTIYIANTQATRDARFGPPILRLRHRPVRSITSIFLDHDANFGQSSGAFPTDSELDAGEDYALMIDEDNALSLKGSVMRNGGRNWPAVPGSVRVAYVSGYTADELNGDDANVDASDIKNGVLLEYQERFNLTAQQQAGSIMSETLGDYSYTLAGAATTSVVQERAMLSEDGKNSLRSLRKITVM